MTVPIEVFLIAVILIYFLGRRHGKKAIKNQFKELWK